LSRIKENIITENDLAVHETPLGTGPDSAPIAVFDNSSPNEAEFSIRDFLKVLRRRKAIVIQTFFVVVAVGIAVTLATKPLYRSTSQILVEGKSTTLAVSDTSNPLNSLFLPSSGHEVATQVQILGSPALLGQVFKVTKHSPQNVHVDIHQVGSTDVIEISALASVAEDAQEIAQKLPEVYLDNVKEDRIKAVNSALDFAKKQLKDKTATLAKDSLALEKFKNRSKIVDASAQQSGDIASAAAADQAVEQARGNLAQIAARLNILKETRQELPTTIKTPVVTTNTDAISRLTQQLADLKSQRNKLLFLYKPNDDKVQEIDSQIEDMKKRLEQVPKTTTTITQSPNPAIPAAEAALAEARAAYASAKADLDVAQSASEKINASLDKYNSVGRNIGNLQRSIDDAAKSVEMLTQSVEELNLRKTAAAAAVAPVRVIASASRAQKVSPRVSRNIVMSVILGLLLGCAAAMLQNTLDDRVSDEEEARELLGTPVLGYSPIMSDGYKLITSVESNSPLLERFRMLRSNVQFSLFNRPSRSVLITSTGPGEGKTSIASNLAVAMAMDKRQVVLVDSDLRRPRVHEIFGMEAQPGLTNVLVGQVDLADALRETNILGLRILTAGALPPNSVELLNSPAMDKLYSELKESSDIIIFDSPPVLATADAQVLSSRVDGVLYVMELGKVKRSAMQRSFELLHQARAHILGILFNKVDQNNGDHYDAYNYYDEYISDDKDGKGKGSQDSSSKGTVWYHQNGQLSDANDNGTLAADDKNETT
jgi:capsular exopolysaccharide synthesis family protein